MHRDDRSDEILREGVRLAERVSLSIAVSAAPIPDAPQTIGEAVAGADRYGDTEAVVGADYSVTYGDLADRVAKAAAALVDLGVQPLDRIAVTLSNCAEIVIAFLAVQRLGAIWVGVNEALAIPEKAYILEHSEASVYLAEEEAAEAIGRRHGVFPALRHVVVASADSSPSDWADRTRNTAPLDPAWPEALPYLPAAIAYTSGTTGFPKGAVHSQHNMMVAAVAQRNRGILGPDSRIGQALPLTILNIMIVGPVTTLVSGATTVAIDRNSAHGVVDWCRRERLTRFLVAPPTIHDLVTADDILPADLAGVTHPGGGGAGISDELRAAFQAKFGRQVPVAYGMTEAPTAVVAETDDEPSAAGACGTVSPQVCVTVRDEHGQLLPVGEDGELCVSGATTGPWAGVYTPMLGYWGQPEATAEALGEGFYRTGDIGHFDEAGRCYVLGRRSEMILRGGMNVYPAEIERIVLLHPGVRACAVIGRPDERLGEEIVAVVERRPGQTVDAASLSELCAVNLSKYKVPADFLIVDALPRNQMDKVARARLRDIVVASGR